MEFRSALVVGGAGFIGSHLAEALLQQGLKVVVLDNLLVGKRENLPEQVKLVVGDVRDAECISTILEKEKIDIIFHEAAIVSIRGSVDQFINDADVNLTGTLTLLNAMRNSQVKKLIFASTMAVYADTPNPHPVSESHDILPISPYGIAKLAAERYCELICHQFSIKCVILRYFNTYGIRQTYTPYVGVVTIFINKLLKGETPIIFGDGEQKRDFIHVYDIVQANILAMQSNISQKIFNVGSGIGTSVNEIAAALLDRLAPHLKPKYLPEHHEELRYSIAGIESIQKELGFVPKYLTPQFDEIIQYWRENPL